MTLLSKMLMAAAGMPTEILPESIDLDGTNDYFSRASDFTGNTDGKTFTFSCWVYHLQNVGSNIYSTTGPVNQIAINAGYDIRISLRDTATGAICLDATVNDVIADYTFNHILISIDLANTSNRYVYVNDVDVTSVTTWSIYDITKTINFTAASHSLGLGEKGRITHPYIDYTYRDLSIEANRRIFSIID